MKHPCLAIRSLLIAAVIAGAALPVRGSSAAGNPAAPSLPAISLSYYNALPMFDIRVSGQSFTPHGRADVYILQNGHFVEHDVVGVSAQGTFTDSTTLACDFQTHEARAYDRRSGQWSNTATLGGPCPG